MKRIRVFVFVLVGFCLVGTLASCGGGGSSAGRGSDRSATPFAGQYNGAENLSLSGPGGTFPVGILPLTIFIDPNGGVVVIDSSGISYVGELGNAVNQRPANHLVASAFVSIPTPPDLFCAPSTFSYGGNIVGDSITGNATGSFFCTGRGATATLTLHGPISATRVATGPAPGATPPPTQQPGTGLGSQRRGGSEKDERIVDTLQSMF